MELIIAFLLSITAPTQAPLPVTACDPASTPTRLFGIGELLEDESPYYSPCGEQLRAYGDGKAFYSDGWITDGKTWWKA
ncbi:hypothetical protein SEA_ROBINSPARKLES_119 [Gordonia phage RobinSparkles]|nr:hypothetical protein SEA_ROBINSPARKLES_119 [Gordonia phage RobinSparkles]